MPADTTLIRVPSTVRDRVRRVAEERQETFGQVIDHGLDLIEKERFWNQVAEIQPDKEYLEEFAVWDKDDYENNDE